MTHPGMGPLTALAYVVIIATPSRFHGGKQRLGHISKQGNSLLRFLLVELRHYSR
jgi:transposase